MNYHMVFGDEGLPFNIATIGVNSRKTHWHNHIEFLLVLEGSVDIRIRDEEYRLVKDDFFMVNDKEIHSVIRTTDKNVLLLLQIDNSYYTKYYSEFKHMVLDNNYFNREENRKKADVFKKHMANMILEHSKKDYGYKLKIGSEVNLFLRNIINAYNEVQIKSEVIINKDEKFIKIKEMMNYIDENFQEGIDLDILAEEFYFSTSYISRFFKSMTGINFQQYLNYIRLDKASELLLYTNKSITNIAVEIGLNNVKTLNRLFRYYYDSSPSEYREKYKGINMEIQQKIDENDRKFNSYLPIDVSDAYKTVFKYLDVNNGNDAV